MVTVVARARRESLDGQRIKNMKQIKCAELVSEIRIGSFFTEVSVTLFGKMVQTCCSMLEILSSTLNVDKMFLQNVLMLEHLREGGQFFET